MTAPSRAYPRAPGPSSESLQGRCYGDGGEDVASIDADANRMESPMQKLNDLSRSLTLFEPDGTLIAVVEMSLMSWLVAGIVPGVERQPLKKLGIDQAALLKLLYRWREEAEKAGHRIKRIAVASPSSVLHPLRAREETAESRGMPCLFLNTERGFGGKPPKKSGFRRHLAGSKMPKEGSKMRKETFFTAISRWLRDRHRRSGRKRLCRHFRREVDGDDDSVLVVIVFVSGRLVPIGFEPLAYHGDRSRKLSCVKPDRYAAHYLPAAFL